MSYYIYVRLGTLLYKIFEKNHCNGVILLGCQKTISDLWMLVNSPDSSLLWMVFRGKLRQLFRRAVPTLPEPGCCLVQVLRELNWRSHQSLHTSSIGYNSCFLPNVLLARNTKSSFQICDTLWSSGELKLLYKAHMWHSTCLTLENSGLALQLPSANLREQGYELGCIHTDILPKEYKWHPCFPGSENHLDYPSLLEKNVEFKSVPKKKPFKLYK